MYTTSVLMFQADRKMTVSMIDCKKQIKIVEKIIYLDDYYKFEFMLNIV